MSVFKNLNVSIKLWLIVIPAVLALAGLLWLFVTRSNEIQSESKAVLYDEVFVSTALILNADRDFYQAAVAEKELYLNDELTAEERETLLADFDENAQQTLDRITEAMGNLSDNEALYSGFKHPNAGVSLSELYSDFSKNFNLWKYAYVNKMGRGDMAAHLSYFDQAREEINLMTELLEDYANVKSAQMADDVRSSVTVSVAVISAVVLLIVFLSVVILFYLRNNIRYITKVSQRIAGGELSVELDRKRLSQDELGRLCAATGEILRQLNAYADYIKEITDTLEAMAQGDMRIRLRQDYAGGFSVIKEAFVKLSEGLGGTLQMIRSASEQVNGGASMIASGAQTLAGGTEEQAGAVEELSAVIGRVSEDTESNLAVVTAAGDSMTTTLVKIDESTRYMEEMLAAMKSIGDTANKIKSVIKLIDDIAFQTNILALNAAVEAARAGQHGKGFAVVAGEVKNLATKSAEAAKTTSELIGSSITSVEAGIKIAGNTAEALEELSAKIESINKAFSEISSSSSQQAGAINEIKLGISQIAGVVTTNSATAEESASTSQELSSQAELLYNEVRRFRLGEDEQEA